jgi:DNA-3-methyladenine glycosylase
MMAVGKRLGRDFFNRPTLQVARDLLGTRLVRLDGNQRLSGIVTETEGYCGEEDLACHARAGRTNRTAVMYGLPGVAYVYFTYGMHWMLNFITETEGQPEAVLVRGIRPEEGIETIAQRRNGRPEKEWTNGPGKLCQALGIDGTLNGADLTQPDAALFVEAGSFVKERDIQIGPRVGLGAVPEPWLSKPWRFFVRDN